MMRPPAWCAPWIGKPFRDHGRGPNDYDCWGLVRAVLEQEFSITGLPDYGETYGDCMDPTAVAKAVRAGLECGWSKVDGSDTKAGDLLILNLKGRPWHCGVAIGGDWFMHVVEGSNTVCERFTDRLWRRRIEGFYRHVSD